MKWELDLWYELWDRAGSQGLDTWYDIRGEAHDHPDTGDAQDAGPDAVEDGRENLTDLLYRATAQGRAHGNGGAVRGWLGSIVLASLLLSEVASAMVGTEAIFFSAIVAAWLVLPAVVGARNVLDAGCFYMLISLGIVVVVSAAS